MYKIAHISDLHISFSDEDENGKKLVDLLLDIKEKKCDHTIITGDLVENPNPGDLQYVREILAKFDLLDSSKLSIVPGNHDIFGGAYKGFGTILFPLRCRDTDYEKNLDEFIDIFKETFPGNNSYPYLKINGNTALIAVNSVQHWSLKDNPEGSNGYIDDGDYEKLKNLFSSEDLKDKIKIVLLHHHVHVPELNEKYPAHSLWLKTIDWKMKMHKRKTFLSFIRKHKVKLLLHGHTHVNEISMDGKITVVNSSAASIPLTDDRKRMYNIISIPGIDEESVPVKIETVYL